jgi:hypothetical protein
VAVAPALPDVPPPEEVIVENVELTPLEPFANVLAFFAPPAPTVTV